MRTESSETVAVRAMADFRAEVSSRRGEDIDLRLEERRIQELANAWAREAMADLKKRADTDSSEVAIEGQRWGNRRVHRGEYQTIFGVFVAGAQRVPTIGPRSRGNSDGLAPRGSSRERTRLGWRASPRGPSP